jgi:pyruvate ferredoxin oxidoreductase alpha subunit
MGSELDRTAESPALSTGRPSLPARVELVDPTGAISLAETMAGSQLLGTPGAAPDSRDPGARRGAVELLRELERRGQRGERAAVIAGVREIMSARAELRALARGQYGVVVHAIASHGAEDLSAALDVGWAVLCASGPEDSFDLTLAARRAAEDSGVPFLIVHALADRDAPAGHGVAMVTLPDDRACHVYLARPVEVGDAGTSKSTPPPAPGGVERVPFALSSALRELGALTGRRHDMFERAPMGEPHLVLVGVGAVGDALVQAIPELRMRGYDVGALHVWSMRPFPGPRLVKALSRALAVAVLEAEAEPLSDGGALTRAVKVAFADALTWAPGYPGIGRIPKLFTGTVGASFDLGDLASICDNMLADGPRTFSLTDPDSPLPRSASAPGRAWSVRALFSDEPTAEASVDAVARGLLSSAGLKSHALVTRRGADVVADIVASREPARGTALRRPARLIVAQDATLLTAATLAGLELGGVVAVAVEVGGASPLDALSEGARAMLRERRGRIVALGAATGDRAAVAGAFAGATLAVAAHASRLSVTAADVDAVGASARVAFEAAQEAVTVASRVRDAAQVPLA